MTDNVITFDVAEAKKLRRCRLMGGIRQGGYRYNKARYDLLEAYWHFDQCSEYVGPAIDEIAAVMDELLVDSQERWTAMPNGELVFADARDCSIAKRAVVDSVAN